MRVCVVGDGISALASAFYALRAGFDVVVVPLQREKFWLEQHFEHGGDRFDCFHQPIHSSDAALCGFLSDMELLPRLIWHDASSGVFDADQRRYLDSTAAILGNEALSPIARWRAYYALRRLLSYSPLPSDLRWGEWLERNCGVAALATIAEPLLSAAYGGSVYDISARSAQLLVRASVHESQRRQAVYSGGLSAMVEALRNQLLAAGATLEAPGSITQIRRAAAGALRVHFGERTEIFDAMIASGPASSWIKLVDAPEEHGLPDLAAEPEGVVSVVALLRGCRKPLPHTSVLRFSQRSDPFSWIHAPGSVRGEHGCELRPVYLTHRGPSHLPVFLADDDTWIDHARSALRDLGGNELLAAVERIDVFRTRSVDGADARPSPARALPLRLESLPVFLSTMARSPMRPIGLESSVMVAREAVDALVQSSADALLAAAVARAEARRAAQRRVRLSRTVSTVLQPA